MNFVEMGDYYLNLDRVISVEFATIEGKSAFAFEDGTLKPPTDKKRIKGDKLVKIEADKYSIIFNTTDPDPITITFDEKTERDEVFKNDVQDILQIPVEKTKARG